MLGCFIALLAACFIIMWSFCGFWMAAGILALLILVISVIIYVCNKFDSPDQSHSQAQDATTSLTTQRNRTVRDAAAGYVAYKSFPDHDTPRFYNSYRTTDYDGLDREDFGEYQDRIQDDLDELDMYDDMD